MTLATVVEATLTGDTEFLSLQGAIAQGTVGT
jgi:hypothetical protein